MALRAERLNESKGAHDRDLGRVSELGRVAIFSPGCTCEMGGNRWGDEYFEKPLIDVRERVHAPGFRARWFRFLFGPRAQSAEPIPLEMAAAVSIDDADCRVGSVPLREVHDLTNDPIAYGGGGDNCERLPSCRRRPTGLEISL